MWKIIRHCPEEPNLNRTFFTKYWQMSYVLEGTRTLHKYNTIQTNNIHQKHTVKKFGKLTTDYQGANIWNNIPNSIRTLKTVKTFSKKLKRKYINTY
jgi:hypothetical protein